MVPVPTHGCLSLRDLRSHFPGATGLHYMVQDNLVTVCQSIPYKSGILDRSKVVLHLPRSFSVWLFVVSCGDLLSENLNIEKNHHLKCDSIQLFIDRINSKLKSLDIMIDCSHLVLEDLYILEQLIENEPNQVKQVLEETSRKSREDSKVVKHENLQKLSDVSAHITCRPKLVRKLPKLSVFKNDDSYGFSDTESGEDQDKNESIIHAHIPPVFCITSECFSSRPKLVKRHLCQYS